MITFEEGYNIVKQSVRKLGKENIDLQDSLYRVLADDVFSDVDMPPFNKSAVDGFACRQEDLANQLKIIETIPAGLVPSKSIGRDQCARIMTGAVVPEGADTVIMVEDTSLTDENTVKFIKGKTNINICYTGEDVKRGDLVLQKGILIKPQDIAIMASVGYVKPLVYKKVKAGVISTGDELVEPDKKPLISQIRNSNASQLMAQLKSLGIDSEYIGIARDTRESTYDLISRALKSSDIVILTGGVSMGEYDYVPEILNQLGVEIQFKSLAIQPGRPTVFGTKENRYIFGLPGNPVSSFVLFEIMVKPFIYYMMGHDFNPVVMKLVMGKDYSRRKSSRKSLLPVKIGDDGKVYPVEYHGSAHIHAYVFADGIVIIDMGKTLLRKDEIVDVRQV